MTALVVALLTLAVVLIITSKTDWNEYFECRKKFDIEMTKEQQEAIFRDAIDLRKAGKIEESENLLLKLPAPANVMLSAKTRFGFKATQEYNLTEAKKAYPDEF